MTEPIEKEMAGSGAARRGREVVSISHIPTTQLRDAAKAWREADYIPGIFGGRKAANTSLHDHIDGLISEIDRLRNLIKEDGND